MYDEEKRLFYFFNFDLFFELIFQVIYMVGLLLKDVSIGTEEKERWIDKDLMKLTWKDKKI